MNARSVVAAMVAITASIVFTVLLVVGKISEPTYVGLLVLAALVGVVLHGFQRVQELDFKNLKVTLDRMEQVRDEVYATAADLQKVSLLLSELMLFQSSFQSRLGSKRSHKYQNLWTRKKAQELLDALSVSPEEKDKVFRFADALAKMDGVRRNENGRQEEENENEDEGSPNRSQSDQMWDKIIDIVQAECEAPEH